MMEVKVRPLEEVLVLGMEVSLNGFIHRLKEKLEVQENMKVSNQK
jgi:hypothetical protein